MYSLPATRATSLFPSEEEATLLQLRELSLVVHVPPESELV